MPAQPGLKWTREKCQEAALKFEQRKLFKSGNFQAYEASRVNGWLDDVCAHMIKGKHLNPKWSEEKLRELFSQYTYKNEIKINHPGAVLAARKSGIYKELTINFKPQGSGLQRRAYSIEFTRIKEVYIGITYNLNLRKWQHLYKGSSNKFVRRNLENGELYEWVEHNTSFNKHNAKLFEERVIKQYIERGWHVLNINDAGGLGGNVLVWTKNACMAEASRYNSRSLFQREVPGAYGSALKNGWLNEICSHMTSTKVKDGTWTEEKIREEAKLFTSRKSFQKQRGGAANKARKIGILNNLFPKARVHKIKGFWDLENCKEAAKECRTLKELRTLNQGAYSAVVRNNWQKVLFPNTPMKIKWTKEKVIQVAKYCRNSSDLRKRYNGAWDKAYR